MRIERVHLDSFMGSTTTLDIPARTVLAGPNGCGKTRVVRAITIAITGVDPALGKRGIMTLASARSMRVGVDCIGVDDRRFAISRRFTSTDKGTVKEELQIAPDTGERGLRARDAKIAEVLGGAILFDPDEFFGFSPAKRAAYLASIGAGADAMSLEEFLEAIAPPSCEAWADVLAPLRSAWNPTAPPSANLAASNAVIASAVSSAAAAKKEAEQALKRLMDKRSTMQVALGKSAADLGAERAKLREQVEELSATLAADTERRRQVESVQQQARAADRDVDKARRKIEKCDDVVSGAKKVLAEMEEAAELARANRSTIEPPDDPPRDESAIEAALETKSQARAEADAADKLLRGLCSRRDRAGESGSFACPISSGLDCPAGDTVRANLAEAIEAALTDYETKVQEADRTAQEYEAIMAREHERAIRRSEYRKQVAQAVKAERKAVADAERKVEMARAALATAEAERAAADEALRDALARQKDARKRETEAPGVIDTSETEKLVAATRERIADIDEAIAAAERVRAIDEEILHAEAAAAAARESASTLRGVAKTAKSVTGRALSDSMRPLLDTVEQLLAGVRPGWALEAVAVEGGINIMARTSGETLIPWRALSGGESAIFTAALSLAIVRLVDPPAKLLLLEAAEVDGPNLDAFLAILGELGSEFDSIVVASCHAASVPDGWSLIDLGATR